MSETTALPLSTEGFASGRPGSTHGAARAAGRSQEAGVGVKIRSLLAALRRVAAEIADRRSLFGAPAQTAKLNDHLLRDIGLDSADAAAPTAPGLDSAGEPSLWIIHRKRWLS